MAWWQRKRAAVQQVTAQSLPQLQATWLSRQAIGDPDVTGLDECGVLGISAMYRAVSLIAGQLATLTLTSYRTGEGGRPQQVPSVFDDPDGPDGQTPYEWKESLFVHRLLHGNAFALKMTNGAGSIERLPLVHPLSVTIEEPTPEDRKADRIPVGGKWFRVKLADNTTRRLDARSVWHVPGMSLDGVRGIGLLDVAKRSLAATRAGDRAAANLYERGALIAGVLTPEDEYDITEDLDDLKAEVRAATSGPENAGMIAVLNRRLKLQNWAMTMEDAQFLQGRQFQIEEIARWTGVPPHLLMQTEKQTSWGTGVEEQNRALGRTVLAPYATGFEQRASRLLQNPRWVTFDFAALERPSPDREIELDLQQVAAGVMTVDEYRAKRGWTPLEQTEPAAGDDEGDDDAPPAP